MFGTGVNLLRRIVWSYQDVHNQDFVAVDTVVQELIQFDLKGRMYNCQHLRNKYSEVSSWKCDVLLPQGTCTNDDKTFF